MDSFFETMQASKIDILCEGYLHFRTDEIRYWKLHYFALIDGALVTFKDKECCHEFQQCMYANDELYKQAFDEFVVASIPMIEPKIAKREDNEAKSLKVFIVSTAIGKWHFGAMEA